MAVDYTRIINEIIPEGHPNSSLSDGENYLILNEETRTLVPENGFNTVIGTTNDINTNIVTIKIPASVEGHGIAECDYKLLKWLNTASG